MTNELDLAAIRERLGALPQDEWAVIQTRAGGGPPLILLTTGVREMTTEDYQFAAHARQDIPALIAEIERLNGLINTPHTADFLSAIPLEAAHQLERWGSGHDADKTAWDWFWLVGYLAQKAATAEVNGDVEKAKHHTISTSAAMLNWFRRLDLRREASHPTGEGQ